MSLRYEPEQFNRSLTMVTRVVSVEKTGIEWIERTSNESGDDGFQQQ